MEYYNNRKDLIECASIKVEIVRPSATYLEDGSALNFQFNYNSRTKDIEKTMKFLKLACEELGYPYARIYLSGFALLTEDYIWPENRILASLKAQTQNIRNFEENNIAYIKK